MKAAMLLGSMLALSIGTGAAAVENDVITQLVPTGTLRVGVATAPARTPVFVAKDAAGGVRGVSRDLGAALAKALGVPMDEECRKRVDFRPPYFVIESTYLAAASDIKTLAEVDRPGITVVAIAGSATMRAAGRSLTTAKIVPAKTVDEAMAMMKAGTVQAFALTQDALPLLQSELPGSRILDGAFQTTGVAIAVQKDRPAALAYVTAFIEGATANGVVRRAFDDAGLNRLPIAP